MLREAIRFVVEQLAQTPPLAGLISAALSPTPGMSDAQLDTYVKEGMFSSWHPVGTCLDIRLCFHKIVNYGTGTTSMLPLDQGGVVDSSLKVYGTQNVYVADAGIIPLVGAVSAMCF